MWNCLAPSKKNRLSDATGSFDGSEDRDEIGKDTELVVLSACETAHSVIGHREGVYGLVRAFRIASARRVMVAHDRRNSHGTASND